MMMMSVNNNKRTAARVNLVLYIAITVIGFGCSKPLREPTTVAILGGGISGIAAARELENAGMHDWILIEQWDDRLGGRFFTSYLGEGSDGCPAQGCPVEIGQRYIQGIQRNPLWDLAQSINFRSHHVNYNKVIVYDTDGKVVKKPPFIEWEKAFTCAEKAGLILNCEPSQFTQDPCPPFTPKDGRQLLDDCGWKPDSEHDLSQVKDAIEWFDMDFEYGRAPENCSAYAFPELTYFDFRDADYYGSDIQGFEKIINFLKEDLPTEKIFLGTRVTRVSVDDDNSVHITTDRGEVITAMYAISTIPFGVIKDGKDPKTETADIFPILPSDTVDKFIMGGYHSSYLQFKRKFWQDTEFLLTAQNAQNPLEEPVIGFKPLDTGHPNNYWPGSNILQANAGGDSAIFFDKLCFEDQSKLTKIILKRLNSMYPGVNLVNDDILDFACTRWGASESFFGAWFQFGPHATPDDYEELHKRRGNLLFSGESSCRRYYGFGHGALLAGWRDANIVLGELPGGYDAVPENRCEALPENQGNTVPRSRRFRG